MSLWREREREEREREREGEEERKEETWRQGGKETEEERVWVCRVRPKLCRQYFIIIIIPCLRLDNLSPKVIQLAVQVDQEVNYRNFETQFDPPEITIL